MIAVQLLRLSNSSYLCHKSEVIYGCTSCIFTSNFREELFPFERGSLGPSANIFISMSAVQQPWDLNALEKGDVISFGY